MKIRSKIRNLFFVAFAVFAIGVLGLLMRLDGKGCEGGIKGDDGLDISLTALSDDATLSSYTQEKLEQMNGEFDLSAFGGAHSTMPSYTKPSTEGDLPTVKAPAVTADHPYLFFTSDEIGEIYNQLGKPEFSEIAERFWAYANSTNEGRNPGVFKDETTYSGGNPYTYRYNKNVIAAVEAKALAYLLLKYEASLPENAANRTAIEEKAEIYGLEAIIGAKNMMLTLDYNWPWGSSYNGASHLSVNVAKVYDWCYDLMDEDDKNQIISGLQHKIISQFETGMNKLPPNGLTEAGENTLTNGSISGHGTGPQFIRNWLIMALAVAKEASTWWEYVGARYYTEYVPVVNYLYQGGSALFTQGTGNYGTSKYYGLSWAAWILESATGTFPYADKAAFVQNAYIITSHLQPNEKYFQTGDGTRTTDGANIPSAAVWLFAAYFGNDPTLGALAKELLTMGDAAYDRVGSVASNDKTSIYGYGDTQDCTFPTLLILTALGPEINEEPYENVKTVQYFCFPQGTITARSSWAEDAAAAYMRIGELTTSNHDHLDHGTFQIYYKGLLAGSTGAYKSYGKPHDYYYHKATVAHNGLLVYNPDYATYRNNNNSDLSAYYYSGGQFLRTEQREYDGWLDSGEYIMADVYAADTDENSKWAYIAGDLTKAYTPQGTSGTIKSSVSYIGRKMLTVFTDDPDYPMLFFTYDQITSANNRTNFTKTFLLHTVNEPTINSGALTATVTEGDGKLVLHSVTGAKSISKIGGTGKKYWVNGYTSSGEDIGINLTDTAVSESDTSFWGRIELTTKGNVSDNMLTAMYVTDATNNQTLTVTKLSGTNYDGAMIADTYVAIFARTTNKTGQLNESFSFTASGEGTRKYYISGVDAGNWKITVGDTVIYKTVGSESMTPERYDNGNLVTETTRTTTGLLAFTADAGEVTIEPYSGEIPKDDEDGAITDISVSLGADLSLNYYATLPDGVSAEALAMSFTALNGAMQTGVAGELVTEGNMAGKYRFTFSNIGPHQLGMKVTAELYNGEGLLGTKEFSVEEYCTEALSKYAGNEELVQLINDLIIYAKASEAYVNQSADAQYVFPTAASWSVTGSSYTPSAADDKFVIQNGQSEGLYVRSAGIKFGVYNRIYFKISSASLATDTVTLGAKTYKVSQLTQEDGYYVLYSAPIYASEFDNTCCLTLNDGTNVTKISYSVYSYAYRMYNSSSSDVLKELVLALYRYGKSCENYLGELREDEFTGKDDLLG